MPAINKKTRRVKPRHYKVTEVDYTVYTFDERKTPADIVAELAREYRPDCDPDCCVWEGV